LYSTLNGTIVSFPSGPRRITVKKPSASLRCASPRPAFHF